MREKIAQGGGIAQRVGVKIAQWGRSERKNRERERLLFINRASITHTNSDLFIL